MLVLWHACVSPLANTQRSGFSDGLILGYKGTALDSWFYERLKAGGEIEIGWSYSGVEGRGTKKGI